MCWLSTCLTGPKGGVTGEDMLKILKLRLPNIIAKVRAHYPGREVRLIMDICGVLNLTGGWLDTVEPGLLVTVGPPHSPDLIGLTLRRPNVPPATPIAHHLFLHGCPPPRAVHPQRLHQQMVRREGEVLEWNPWLGRRCTTPLLRPWFR
jgi:hypothetical protein